MNDYHDDIRSIKDSCLALERGIATVDKTLAVQATQLEYHIKRTDMLEKRIERFESWRWFFVGMAAVVGVLSKVMGWL